MNHQNSSKWRIQAVSALAIQLILLETIAYAQVTTSQYDNQRTGATLNERLLTPRTVNPEEFGKLGEFKVDGAVYAQPLFLPAVEVPGKGTHDILFIATEHDSVYAFDAYRTTDLPLWHVSLLNKKKGETPVSMRAVACPFIQPEVGITPTPVIDRKTGTLYVLARTSVDRQYFQFLHALAVTTGAEKFGGPKVIAASIRAHGDGAENGQVRFDPLRENPRASLLLINGVVYLTWASSCDVDPYHGWVMAYDAATLAQKAVLNVTPDGKQGGIWASDTGPAADSGGNIYVPTGNGTFDASSAGRDYGDSVLKLKLTNAGIEISDYFTPFDQAKLSDADADLGSSGPLLLPDQPGTHRHLLLQPTKNSTLYVIDRDQMGQFSGDGDAVVQRLRMGGQGAYGAMAYWNGHVFFATSDDFLRDYTIAGGHVTPSKSSNTKFENPGASPTVSADGTQDAIVWAIATKTWDGRERPAILYAFDAKQIAQPIYSSEQNSQRDRAATATRFVIPIVVNGHVYFAARNAVEVYGLLQHQ
jgi:hypothetical protein